MPDIPSYQLDALNLFSPLEVLEHPKLTAADLQLWVKRDDLLVLPKETDYPAFCGNKWRKLKYNLYHARAGGYEQLLTFGGAYSNHIAAVAAAGTLFGFSTIGIIRGEPAQKHNPTLAFAKKCGMKLHYVNRSIYRQKDEPDIQEQMTRPFGRCYILPEGGTNALALQGCQEIIHEIETQLSDSPTHICVSAGTGGTAAGIIQATHPACQILIFPALKGSFMQQEITPWVSESKKSWKIIEEYHFGGYAKWKPPLIQWMNTFYDETGIKLDPIYTGKLAFGLFSEIEKGSFSPGSRIVMIHTGGLQGRWGFMERYGSELFT